MDKKIERIISIYHRLSSGEIVNKAAEASRFKVTKKSIQRDLEDIRTFFSNNRVHGKELVYDRSKKGYLLVSNNPNALTNSEIFTVCKILLESRSLVREEMIPLIDKLVKSCVPYDQFQKVSRLIANEKYHYLEPHHGKKFMEAMWEIGSAVFEHRLMQIRYRKLKVPAPVSRLVQPVGIMFSEYYFYLIAYLCSRGEEDCPGYSFPAVYRIDRIEYFEILAEHFQVPYSRRFEEGEFRKRIQFMFGGKLRRIRFKYIGLSIEAVLDRLPTARVLEQDERGWTVEAEVYGDGVDMWIQSQGENIILM